MASIDTPLVSVIMAVYNGEEFLREAVLSVLNQTLTEFEFIIVNDGSTDASSQILNSFDDERIVLVERGNRGLPSSLNEAISIAKGEYIARMDADDVSLPNRLQLQYEYMRNHPEVGLVGGQALIIDAMGGEIGEARKPVGFELIKRYIEYACPVLHPTYFVRRRVYESIARYRQIPIEDYDFLFRIVEHGVIIENMPNFLIEYRCVSTGLTLFNPQRTTVLTRAIKKMHELRVRGLDVKEKELMLFVNAYDTKPSWWFNKVYVLRSIAKNALFGYKKRGGRIWVWSMIFLIFLISLLHYQVFMDSFSTYKASKLV